MASGTPADRIASVEAAVPKITIQFCIQCKWNLRAAYFAQELLQTFATSLGEVSLRPSTGGIFIVTLETLDEEAQLVSHVVWDRKRDGGFPETKELKKKVRDIIDPKRDLGHVDGKKSVPDASLVQQESGKAPPPPSEVQEDKSASSDGKPNSQSAQVCEDCR